MKQDWYVIEIHSTKEQCEDLVHELAKRYGVATMMKKSDYLKRGNK